MTPLSELIGGDEMREAEQTCAKVLSDKEDDGGDVEIAKPFRDCGEGDSCGGLRLYMHEGKKERQVTYRGERGRRSGP